MNPILKRIRMDERALLVCETHAVIEAQLRCILQRICRSPEDLRTTQLSFQQLFSLCCAVVGRGEEPYWQFAARLHEVREALLDTGTWSVSDEVVDSLFHAFGVPSPQGPRMPSLRETALGVSTYFLAIAGSARLQEGYGPDPCCDDDEESDDAAEGDDEAEPEDGSPQELAAR